MRCSRGLRRRLRNEWIYNQLVFNLGRVQLNVIAYLLRPLSFKIKENVATHIFLQLLLVQLRCSSLPTFRLVLWVLGLFFGVLLFQINRPCLVGGVVLRRLQFLKPGFKLFNKLPVFLFKFNCCQVLLVCALLVVKCKEQGIDVEL